jgi:hypothetical protein
MELSLTNIDLEPAHVLAVELFLGIFGITVVIELNEGVRSLLHRYIVR